MQPFFARKEGALKFSTETKNIGITRTFLEAKILLTKIKGHHDVEFFFDLKTQNNARRGLYVGKQPHKIQKT